MAVNRVPVLKRCRSLDLDPVFLGYDKKSKRKSPRAGKKMSEYGLQLRERAENTAKLPVSPSPNAAALTLSPKGRGD